MREITPVVPNKKKRDSFENKIIEFFKPMKGKIENKRGRPMKK